MDETLQVSHGLVFGRRIGYRYLSLISTGLILVLTLSTGAGNVEGGGAAGVLGFPAMEIGENCVLGV